MICQICGNEGEAANLRCPYCGAKMEEPAGEQRQFIHKTVNLEAGRPVVEVALNRLHQVIADAKRNNVSVITLIHGYGSTGRGGAIRSECRMTLDYMKSQNLISDYIAGEDFNKRSGRVKALVHRYSPLGSDRNLNNGNQGITLVILSNGLLFFHALLSAITFNATFPS
jgi:hypothetical protein